MTKKFTVLIVDDEQPFRKVLHTGLSARGFSIEEARNGDQALELVTDRIFHLVLLDINMPGTSGLETCRRMRTLMPHVGIIMVTVRDSEQDMIKTLEAGADDYITKPVRFGELVARLRAVIRRTVVQTPIPTAIQAGELEIDLEKHVLRRAAPLCTSRRQNLICCRC